MLCWFARAPLWKPNKQLLFQLFRAEDWRAFFFLSRQPLVGSPCICSALLESTLFLLNAKVCPPLSYSRYRYNAFFSWLPSCVFIETPGRARRIPFWCCNGDSLVVFNLKWSEQLLRLSLFCLKGPFICAAQKATRSRQARIMPIPAHSILLRRLKIQIYNQVFI